MAKSIASEFTKGLWKEVPPFRLVLGLCPVLGVTTSLKNGIGMGLATTFVLLCSNILVSLLRKVIPPKVRIACFIIIIATFVIVVEQMMQAFAYTFSRPGRLYPPDRGQLHRPGPRRGIRLQKRGIQVNRGRTGYRPWIHLGAGTAGRRAGTHRHRLLKRRRVRTDPLGCTQYLWCRFRALRLCRPGPGRVCDPGIIALRDEPDTQ
jgi:hypothetical protein